MKLLILFVFSFLLVSCHQTPPPAVVSGLEEPSQTELDSIKNASATKSGGKAAAIKESKTLIYANEGVKGGYTGTIDHRYFRLTIEKTYGDNVEGSVMIGNDKRAVKGKINKLGTEPAPTGDITLYRVLLSETKNPRSGGEYVMTLSLSTKYNSGEGAWISKTKKQQSPILIKERTL